MFQLKQTHEDLVQGTTTSLDHRSSVEFTNKSVPLSTFINNSVFTNILMSKL